MIIEEALDPLILGGKHTNGIGVQIGKLSQKEEKRLSLNHAAASLIEMEELLIASIFAAALGDMSWHGRRRRAELGAEPQEFMRRKTTCEKHEAGRETMTSVPDAKVEVV